MKLAPGRAIDKISTAIHRCCRSPYPWAIGAIIIAHRLTFVASSIPDLIQELDAFAVKQDHVRIRTLVYPAAGACAAHRFCHERTGPAMVGHGAATDAE